MTIPHFSNENILRNSQKNINGSRITMIGAG